jgi:DNA-binding protein YbaB
MKKATKAQQQAQQTKKRFVEPTLTKEASLLEVTLNGSGIEVNPTGGIE